MLRIGAPWLEVSDAGSPRVGQQGASSAATNVHADMDMNMDMDMDVDTLGMTGRSSVLPHDTQFVPVPGPVPAYSAQLRRWIVDSLTHRIRGLGAPDHGFSLVIGPTGSADRTIITYTLMPTAWGDTMVYGARYSRAALDSLFADVLDGAALDAFVDAPGGLLPASVTHGRPARDVLALRVHDAAGRPLYTSAVARPGVDARLQLPARAGGVIVEMQLHPELASTLLIGGLPRSHLPFLLALLALAAALAVVAVTQLRRESELGQLRANFVSSVSHELRTPVAQIRLFAETLRLGRARTERERSWAVEHIDRETLRLSHLVERVLRFSAWQSGVGESGTVSLELLPELRMILDEFQPLARARGVELSLVGDGANHLEAPVGGMYAALRVPISPEALRHIVLNLLDNAVKYGPDGQSVRVTVRVIGASVHLAVEDEGPGIPPAERTRIWKPFVRGAGTGHRGGSGIGLAVVREVADAHGVRSWVESAGLRGARFIVAFPCSTGAPDDMSEARPVVDYAADPGASHPASAGNDAA